MSSETLPDHVPAIRTGTAPVVRGENALVIGATAAGALILGMLAVGAMAIGKMAIGQLLPGRRQKLRRRQVDDLHVVRLTLVEVQTRRVPFGGLWR